MVFADESDTFDEDVSAGCESTLEQFEDQRKLRAKTFHNQQLCDSFHVRSLRERSAEG